MKEEPNGLQPMGSQRVRHDQVIEHTHHKKLEMLLPTRGGRRKSRIQRTLGTSLNAFRPGENRNSRISKQQISLTILRKKKGVSEERAFLFLFF